MTPWLKRAAGWLATTAVLAMFAILAMAGENGRYARVVVAPAWVISVQDGDTITIRREDGQPQRVRFADIDAPERSQAHGREARQALVARAEGRVVWVRVRGRDQYGRWVGTVRAGGEDLNLWLVRRGWAWADRYSRDTRIRSAEREARVGRPGVWAAAMPMPPWEYRRKQASSGAGRAKS